VIAVVLAGCGGAPEAPRSSATPTPDATPTATAAPRASRPLARPRCRDEIPNCASTSGRIVFVERVDPDGDGDLHVVLLGRDGITAPGFTAVDVRRGLRPRRDPRVGQLVTAAGQVQRGTYGQRQIHAVSFRVA
jgi:hypothetical protein